MVVNATWVKHHMQPTPPEGQIHCAICLVEAEPEERNFKLSCSHQFHSACIFRWLQQNEKCPICRSIDPYLDLALIPPRQQDQQSESRQLYNRMMREGHHVPVELG